MSENKIERLIGIDFGTSTSVVKSKRYQDGEPLGNAHHVESVTFEGDPKAMTLVRVNPDGTVTCGAEGEEEIDDSKVYREFKMDLESDDDEKRSTAMKLAEEYLKYLYDRYSHQENDHGEKGDEVSTLVSFPAKWHEETRNFMAEAARNAGFENVSSMDEPTAALFAVLCRKMDEIREKEFLKNDKENLILIVDMGAGTTDLAVCRCAVETEKENVKAEDIKNELILSWPDSSVDITFGGREVDVKLKDYLVKYLCSCKIPAEFAENIAGQGTAVKEWKESSLSPTLMKNDVVKSCALLSNAFFFPGAKKEPFPEINRESFEALIADNLEDYKTLVKGCLDKLEEGSEIDVVILTGGHSNWYFASEIINGTIAGIDHPALKKVQAEKARVMRLSNPQETVALGMVYSKLPFTILNSKPVTPPANDEKKKEQYSQLADQIKKIYDDKNGDSAATLREILSLTLSEYPVPSNLDALKKNLMSDSDKTVYFASDISANGDATAGTIITEDGINATAKEGGYVSITRWAYFVKGVLKVTENNIICDLGYMKSIIYGQADNSVFDLFKKLQKNLAESGCIAEINIYRQSAKTEGGEAAPAKNERERISSAPKDLNDIAKKYIAENASRTLRNYILSDIKAQLGILDETAYTFWGMHINDEKDCKVAVTESAVYIKRSKNHLTKIITWPIIKDEMKLEINHSCLELKLDSEDEPYRMYFEKDSNAQTAYQFFFMLREELRKDRVTVSENDLYGILKVHFSKYNQGSEAGTSVLKTHFGISDNEKVFLAFYNGFIRTRGTIITDRGIYSTARYDFIFGAEKDFTSWDEFINGEIYNTASNITCCRCNGREKALYEGDAFDMFSKLQKKLRKKGSVIPKT